MFYNTLICLTDIYLVRKLQTISVNAVGDLKRFSVHKATQPQLTGIWLLWLSAF